MANNPNSNDWRTLCKMATQENDPYKLLDIIGRINRALEECNRHYCGERKAFKIESVVMPLSDFEEQSYSHVERLPIQHALAGEYDS